jgi:hypothetical protein
MRYPRVIAVRSSARSLILIAAIHLVAAISFVHLVFRPEWLIAGVLALTLGFGLSWRAMRRNAVSLVELGDDGCLRFPGSEVEGRPCGRSADFGWLRWLEWREGRRRVALMLWQADLSPEDWRALGIWLRHKAARKPVPISDAG